MTVIGWVLIVIGVGAQGPVWSIQEMTGQAECLIHRDQLRKEALDVRAIVSIVCEPVLQRKGPKA